jgi:transmembrane sensor
MSGLGAGMNTVVPAGRIEQRAAEWIECRDFGSWTKSDAAALDAWLEESVDHKVAFYRLDFGWQRTARLSALRSADGQNASRQNRPDWIGRTRIIAAAIGVVIICAGGVYELRGSPEVETYATDIGGHRVVTLPNGSLVELNTDTTVRIAAATGERQVWLVKGEAFFQVKHDAAHPFTVIVGEHRVTDLGTKFLVNRQSDRVAVAVVEGRARLETDTFGAKARSAELAPGDVGVATANSLSVSHKAAANLERELGWRRGVLIFHDTALADAAIEFNRYNQQKLVVADAAIARLTVDGTFPANRIGSFARVARDVLGLRVEERGDEIVISR